jgi:hypothetical protein
MCLLSYLKLNLGAFASHLSSGYMRFSGTVLSLNFIDPSHVFVSKAELSSFPICLPAKRIMPQWTAFFVEQWSVKVVLAIG